MEEVAQVVMGRYQWMLKRKAFEVEQLPFSGWLDGPCQQELWLVTDEYYFG